MAKTNGPNGWILRSGLTGLFAIAMATAGWIISEQSRAQAKQTVHGERISVLETRQVGIDITLVRLEQKLDRVLERVTR